MEECPKCKSTNVELVLEFEAEEFLPYVGNWKQKYKLYQCNECMKVF